MNKKESSILGMAFWFARGDLGAGDRIRTGDIDLGKVALYQLSYSRLNCVTARITIGEATIFARSTRPVKLTFESYKYIGLIAACFRRSVNETGLSSTSLPQHVHP